jgi:capsular exopolysaccharide synthesis family protein
LEDLIERPGAVDLREYLTVLKARKWTIIIVTVLAVSAALSWSSVQTPLYQSETRVLVKSLATGDTSVALPGLSMATEQELVTSDPVASLVVDSLDLNESPSSLLSGLHVEGIEETQVLVVSYVSPDPAEAQRIAASFADNYLKFRSDRALESIELDEQGVQARFEAATRQLDDLSRQLEQADRSGDLALASNLETQRSILISRLGVLQQQVDDLQARRTTIRDAGEVIEPANLPSSPASPNLAKNALAALFLGLALGVALAFLRERLDDRFRDRADLERAVGAPVLATVSRYELAKGKFDLAAYSGEGHHASEAYRRLRTGVEFFASQRKIKSIVITSPAAGEGKTATTANLGVVMAQAGRRVILVSSDLRRPTLGNYFGFDDTHVEKGLSPWLAHEFESELDLIQDPGVANLRIICSGLPPDNPAELLTSSRLTELVSLLEQNADLVIFDSPPTLAVADTPILASRVGGTVLVVDASSTHRSATVQAKAELERIGGVVFGTVLNSFDPASTPYYYSGYGYYYSTANATSDNGRKARQKGSTGGRVRRLLRLSR